MKLEEEIKQKSFKNPYQKLMVNILYTGSWLELMETNYLKAQGLTLPQFNVLRILRGQFPQPVTVNDIIDRMLDKSSNASRIVDKLVAKNLAERKVCKQDKRAVDVIITNRGLKVLSEIDKELPKWEKRMKSLSREEADKLNLLLDKLRDCPIKDLK
ncbi:MAG: MarR family transcriptional regulator [Ignavibacteria bacterium]